MPLLPIAGSIAEVLSNGAAVKKGGSIELPFMTISGNAEAGFGNAVQSYHDNDSSEEKKRRRRSLPPDTAPGLVSPLDDADCHAGSSGSTNSGSADEVEAEAARRRARAAAQRKRNASQRKSTKTTKSSATGRRRRRQTEPEETQGAQKLSKEITERAKQFVDKVGAIVQTFIESITQMGAKISQTLKNDTNGSYME